jgi:hypothetical protein
VAEAGTSEQEPFSGVSPEEVGQLLQEDLSAIKEKVKNKKPLTETEIKRLQAHAATAVTDSSGETDAMEPVWVDNQVALAKALRCSRKQIQRYMKLEGDDAPPAPTSDHRYNVTLWKLWAQEHGYLRKTLSTAADRQLLEDKLLQSKIDRQEIDNAVRRGELMSVDEVNRVLTEMVGGVVDGVRGSKHSLAPRVVGLPVPEATKRIGMELDEQLAKLSLGEWAKKKIFWSKVSAHLSDLHKRFNLGAGQSVTS